MKKRVRRPPREDPWRNGSTFPFMGVPPTPYPKVDDFRIAIRNERGLGTVMEWRSVKLGLLTDFAYYAHLEDPTQTFLDAQGEVRSLSDGWRPIGTVQRRNHDLDQGLAFEAWADARSVYVHCGIDEPWPPTILTWYRVPIQTFEAAWQAMLRSLGVSEDS